MGWILPAIAAYGAYKGSKGPGESSGAKLQAQITKEVWPLLLAEIKRLMYQSTRPYSESQMATWKGQAYPEFQTSLAALGRGYRGAGIEGSVAQGGMGSLATGYAQAAGQQWGNLLQGEQATRERGLSALMGAAGMNTPAALGQTQMQVPYWQARTSQLRTQPYVDLASQWQNYQNMLNQERMWEEYYRRKPGTTFSGEKGMGFGNY